MSRPPDRVRCQEVDNYRIAAQKWGENALGDCLGQRTIQLLVCLRSTPCDGAQGGRRDKGAHQRVSRQRGRGCQAKRLSRRFRIPHDSVELREKRVSDRSTCSGQRGHCDAASLLVLSLSVGEPGRGDAPQRIPRNAVLVRSAHASQQTSGVVVPVFPVQSDQAHHQVQTGERLEVGSGTALHDDRVELSDRFLEVATPVSDAPSIRLWESTFEAFPIGRHISRRKAVEDLFGFGECSRVGQRKGQVGLCKTQCLRARLQLRLVAGRAK